MRNTSESPDANEQVQAKPATTKSRAGTRSKTESALLSTPEKPESPEQDTKPATRRRTTSATTTKGASEPAAQHATDTTATPSDTTTRPSRPAAAQRTSTTRKAAATPAAQPEVPTPAEATPRTTPAQRTGGATRSPGQSQPNSGPTTTPTPIQRGNAAGTPAQRPAQVGAPGQRSSQSGAPTYRPTGPGAPAQRPPAGTPPRSNSVGGAPAQQATHYPNTQARPVNRQGGTQTAPNRPGVAIRPGAPRPGAPRPAAPGHPAPARPGTRPATPAQRSQERRAAAVKEKVTGPVSIPPQIVVKDLAELLHTTPNEIIRGLIKHSIFANINQIVEYEKAALVAEELGFEPSLSTITTAPAVQSDRGLSANEAMMATRNDDDMVVIPPVVTIMGHVDHGKTSLLDMIRKTKVAAGEAGGITQYIGAYQVEVNGKKITFLDTPGHEAFTAMRARGAQVTHIAVIVVAADDGVMPQTREAIDHARAAKVPIIIALNKIDKANANPDLVKQQLAEIGVVIEEYGGDVVCVPVSARRGTGIDDLLEMILLVAEVQDIKANPNRPATGVIIEAKLEKNTGPTATVLIQQGTLKMGDNIVVGPMSAKVRAMFNDRGKRIQKAPPSMPVSILGLPEVPNAGDRLEVVASERAAKIQATKVAEQRRSDSMPLGQVSLDTLYMQMQEGKVKELAVVLKCDVQGTAEAIKNALTKVGEENIKVRLIHEGIGNINETDVHLASASGAIIIGFNVKADGAALRLAQKEGVDIRYYDVIYKLIDDIQAALTGMLEPTYREVIEGHAEVMQIFKAGKNTVIAGCRITDGKITRSSQARILRRNATGIVYDGKIASLRRGKDDVREVATGYECGIVLDDFTDFEIGDIIEAYSKERVKTGA
ncbi:MAG: translation initiation factor IF-2 [Chloroflexi bacterium]|nr:MAG: translation initiation factor IF-2 [Chloroflexota bacterium]